MFLHFYNNGPWTGDKFANYAVYRYYSRQKKLFRDLDFGFVTGQVTGYWVERPVLERSVNRGDVTHDYYSSVHSTSSPTLAGRLPQITAKALYDTEYLANRDCM